MAEITDRELFAHALASERRYFGLGASTRSEPGLQLHIAPGFEALPAACVCILDPPESPGAAMGAIASAEAAFLVSGATWARFYIYEMESGLAPVLMAKGYRHRIEIVHGFDPVPDTREASPAGYWRPVRDEQDWLAKATVHAPPSKASDGYETVAEAWLSLERQRAETGGIEFWLYVEDDLPLATTGLMRTPDRVARIKNYYVRADRRRKGIGTTALQRLLLLLHDAGEKAAVVLSVEGSIGERLYRSAGAREIGRIHEWSRGLR
jgi:RimJ/RimL family protein N-acetyltransferase